MRKTENENNTLRKSKKQKKTNILEHLETSQKIYENLGKSMKSTKISKNLGNHRKSENIQESLNVYENRRKSTRISENH